MSNISSMANLLKANAFQMPRSIASDNGSAPSGKKPKLQLADNYYHWEDGRRYPYSHERRERNSDGSQTRYHTHIGPDYYTDSMEEGYNRGQQEGKENYRHDDGCQDACGYGGGGYEEQSFTPPALPRAKGGLAI